jgi:gas vesicle protein
MRFITGVIVGIAGAAAAAAWYLSRSGQAIREEYQIEARLGDLGDQVDARAREIQAKVASQIDDIRTRSEDTGDVVDEASDAASDVASDIKDATAESTNGTAESVGAAIGQAESAIDEGPAAS